MKKSNVRSGIRYCSLILALLALNPISVFPATDPQAVDMGPIKLIPTLDVSEKRNDNIFLEAANETSSTISQLAPSIQFVAIQNNDIYSLTYEGDYGFYSNDSDDNYTDHNLTADAHVEFNSKLRFDLTGTYGRLHDARGTGGSEGAAQARRDPDEYNLKGASGLLEFGGNQAVLGIAVEASVSDIEYRNNLADTVFRDRKDTRLAARLFARFSPMTRTFIELSTKELSYDVVPLAGGSLDSDERAWSLGIEWEITGKTTGTIKGGLLEKDFKERNRGNPNQSAWTIQLQWSPRTYSTFLISLNRAPKETNGTGDFIDSRDYSITWLHDWSERVHTRFSASVGNDEFSNNPRQDDLLNAGFKLSYDFRRWLNIGLAYSYSDRDSNGAVFNYTQNIYAIDFSLSL